MPSVNPGPATTQTPNNVAQLLPVNTNQKPVEIGTNALRLIAVARGVNLAATGDAAVMPVINCAAFAPATIVIANGQVSGVQASVATAGLGVFTAAAGGGTALRAQGALTNNSAAGSSIVAASAVVNLAYLNTAVPNLYVNVGTALANATCDVFLYGYDQS